MRPNYFVDAGELVVHEPSTSAQLWRGKVNAQTCLKCAAIPDSDEAILLVEAGSKERPLFENLFRVRSNGEVVWAASTSGSHDSFVDFTFAADGLLASTWNGIRVVLCVESGKIISEQFTK